MNIRKVAHFIQSLNVRQFQQYLIAFLVGVFLCVLMIMYLSFSYSQELVIKIKKLEVLANKSSKVLAEYQRLMLEQEQLHDLFAKEKEFNIKIYFEQFCKQQGITPVKGWDTTSKNINPQLTEILLNATFKGMTMEKVVSILDAFEKKEVVYIKELSIRAEGNKMLTCEIQLSTALYKRQSE